MTFAALLIALVFGGADQYLGSLSAHPWAADVSLLSAPWLALPYVAGITQQTMRRGALVGLAATALALAGYALMTLSPVENAHLTLAGLRGFVVSDPAVFVGGVVTGPLFGALGQRRSLVGALALAAAALLEPFAHSAIRSSIVAAAEIAAGMSVAPTSAPRARCGPARSGARSDSPRTGSHATDGRRSGAAGRRHASSRRWRIERHGPMFCGSSCAHTTSSSDG